MGTDGRHHRADRYPDPFLSPSAINRHRMQDTGTDAIRKEKGKGTRRGKGKQKEGGHGFPDRGHTQRQSRKTVVTPVSRGQGRCKEN